MYIFNRTIFIVCLFMFNAHCSLLMLSCLSTKLLTLNFPVNFLLRFSWFQRIIFVHVACVRSIRIVDYVDLAPCVVINQLIANIYAVPALKFANSLIQIYRQLKHLHNFVYFLLFAIHDNKFHIRHMFQYYCCGYIYYYEKIMMYILKIFHLFLTLQNEYIRFVDFPCVLQIN